MKKLLFLLLFPILLYSQNVKVRTIWLDTSRANIDTSHIFSPERFHRMVVFDSLFTINGQNVLIATDTTNKWAPKGLYLFPSDTTSFRTFSDLKYLKNADSTTIRNYSNALYQLKGTYLIPSDTVGVAFYNKSNVFSSTQHFTARDYHTSIAVDTMVGKSSGNKVYINDSLNVIGNLKIGSNFNGGIGNYDAGNNASTRSTFIHGTYDSIYSTTTTNGGENYIFGRYNTIGRTNPTGTYGNWLFGQYLRSEGLGLWAFGADDNFQKKIIPFEGTIAFVNENIRHWMSNTMPLYAGYGYTWQSPHVKDSMAFSLTYQKAGSDVDSLAYAQFFLEGQRNFIIDSKGMITYPDRAIRYLQINGRNDNSIRFNARNVSGKAFGNMYLDSGHFYISKGFLGADSLRGSAGTTTYWNKTGYHSGLGASYMGNLSIGSLTTNGNAITSGAITSSAGISGTTVTASDTVIIAKNSGGTAYPQLTIRDDYVSTGVASAGISYIRANTASGDYGFGNYQGNMKMFFGLDLKRFGEGTGIAVFGSDSSITLGNIIRNGGGAVYAGKYYTGTTQWMDASRNLSNIGTISSGAITSTGLSTFGTNSGTATIGAGDSVQVTVTGLTTSGVAVVSYKRSGATSTATADTIASWDINTSDKLSLYGKYGWTVSYWIGKK